MLEEAAFELVVQNETEKEFVDDVEDGRPAQDELSKPESEECRDTDSTPITCRATSTIRVLT